MGSRVVCRWYHNLDRILGNRWRPQRGLLDEERLQSVLRPLSGRLTHPWVQERWAVEHRVSFVPSYQTLVDSIIAASQ